MLNVNNLGYKMICSKTFARQPPDDFESGHFNKGGKL